MTSHKDLRRAILGAGLARANSDVGAPPENVQTTRTERVVSGAVGAVSRSLDQIHHEIQAAQDLIASGEAVVELEPALVLDSLLKDRLEVSENDRAALVESIRAGGQQVPILVRPHPEQVGKYQVAYGHRRLAACRELHIKVKAVVRKLSDAELFLAQGQENTARRDLSFIERASFAYRLEARGVDREAIMSALSTDKTELSKLISVARSVPEDLVKAIGPAPKAGRPRWLKLGEILATDTSTSKYQDIINSPDFAAQTTDERFRRVLHAMSAAKVVQPQSNDWIAPDGKKIATIERSDRGISVSVNKAADPEFGQYLINELPAIYARFQARSAP